MTKAQCSALLSATSSLPKHMHEVKHVFSLLIDILGLGFSPDTGEFSDYVIIGTKGEKKVFPQYLCNQLDQWLYYAWDLCGEWDADTHENSEEGHTLIYDLVFHIWQEKGLDPNKPAE